MIHKNMSSKLWIPRCGDAAILDVNWTFTLQNEYRNSDLFKLIKGEELKNDAKDDSSLIGRGDYFREVNRKKLVTLEKGTELVFDRIYIRQDNKEFASVTFMIKNHVDETFIGERFWAKLDDVNNIVCTMTTRDNPVGGFAKSKYKADVKKKKDPSLVVKASRAADLKKQLVDAEKACILAVNDSKNDAFVTKLAKVIHQYHDRNISLYSWTSGRQLTLAGVIKQNLKHDYYCSGYVPRDEDRLWLSVKSVKNKDGSVTRRMRYKTRYARKQVAYKTWDGKNAFHDGEKYAFGGFDVTTDSNGKITSIVPVEMATPT